MSNRGAGAGGRGRGYFRDGERIDNFGGGGGPRRYQNGDTNARRGRGIGNLRGGEAGMVANPNQPNGHVPTNLANFFNFNSMPQPSFPDPPKRWTVENPPIDDEASWDTKRKVSSFANDDINYVHVYREIAEKKIAEIRIREEENVDVEDNTGVPSVIGTIPNLRPLNDPEVFWKYRTEDRLVDTSHLMINAYRDQICHALKNRQVLIVEGFTGCGKTTQVPQFILDDAIDNNKRVRIAVTQPRRIAAISVANRVCEERGWKLGSLVGYQVGMDRKTTDDTRIVYMTTGVLLQLLIGKKNLNEYTHIIIDEVHERDLETDLLLLVIKKILIDRQDFNIRIILMSATLNAKKFLGYFPKFRNVSEKSSSVIAVSQPSMFQITEYFLDTLSPQFGFEGFDIDASEEPKLFQETYEIAARIIGSLDYLEYDDECRRLKEYPVHMTAEEKACFTAAEFYKKLKEKHNENRKPPPRGAVLVFLPGFMEIDTLLKQLAETASVKSGNVDKNDLTKWVLFPLHSMITAEEQQKVFAPAPPGYRKIILATNIAESSITVPDIKYVIDFCLTKSLSCDPATNFSCLRMEWASKNQCIQRRGRCGRVAPGISYKLISKKFYTDFMLQEAVPEMEKANLESVILNVKSLGMGCPLEVLANAIDPPKQSGIGRAVANLKEVGALTLAVNGTYDAYDGDLTYMGTVMARLPVDFRLGRLIVLGHVFGCVDDAIVIAAGLTTKSPFSHPYSKRLEAWLSKVGWSTKTYSDCFALINAYYSWCESHRSHAFRTFSEEKSWARTYFLQFSVLREMGNLIKELKQRLNDVGIFSDTHRLGALERGFILKLLIAAAFYPNYFVRPRPTRKEYEREIIKECCGFNPMTSVVLLGFPIDQPGKLYAKHLADKLSYNDCIPTFHFKSSKVIVTFDNRGDKIGSISQGVYRAVKMRILRDRLSFLTLPRDDSNKAMRLAEGFIEQNPVVKAPRCIGLPSIEESEIHCFVSHVESPYEFYITRKSDEGSLESIDRALNKNNCRFPVLPELNRHPGALCIVVKQGRYLRGRIDAVDFEKGRAMIYAIDTGLTLWTKFHQIFSVPSEAGCNLATLPALAMLCRLSEVKPSSRHGEEWMKQACKEFTDFQQESSNILTMRVYSVVDGVIAGDLYSPVLGYTIGADFLNKKYIEKSAESQDSIDNNNARRVHKVMKYEEERIRAYNKIQESSWEPSRYISPPDISMDSGIEVTLRGPSSPLEMSFTSMCRSAHMKQVQLEGSSVNSVALDTEPFNTCSRVMIAASVGVAHRSGNLLARDTTIMPPIPGLLSLLAMVFAPHIELRVSDDRTRYTGCVSGLGVDPIERLPVYPDHDMEIIFDVNIDNEDLDLINTIRGNSNMLLREYPGRDCSLEKLREKIRTDLTRLLQRDRSSIDEVWPEDTHAWNKLINYQFHKPSKEYEILENDVFALHTGIQLSPEFGETPSSRPRNVWDAETFDF